MSRRRRLFRFFRSDRGQVLPLVVLSAIVLVGFTGFAVDLGRVWVAKQQLQRAIDAATLAAGQDLPNSATALTDAEEYAGTGTRNPVGGWGVTANAPSVTFECVASGPNYAPTTNTCLKDTSGDNCDPNENGYAANPALPSGATTCNEIRVTETATVRTGLLSMFIPNFTVSASSTAAARGETGVPEPMNIFVILDTTQSMTDACSVQVPLTTPTDPNETNTTTHATKLDCAKEGVRSLLQTLPYTGTTADDDVGIMVFPALSSTLTGTAGTSTATFTGKITNSGTTSTKEKITSVTTNESSYVGDTISGTGIPSGTTIKPTSGSGGNYTVTISNPATSSGTYTFSISVPTTTAPYSLPDTPPMTPPDDETDCTASDSFGVTYPPYAPYTDTPGATAGIPSSDLTPQSGSLLTPYTGPIDNFPGYEAVPLSGDYQTDGDGTLNYSSNLVQSVYWSQCSGQKYPGGDYYGIKDIGGQGSYLAGAITEAQYVLSQQQQQQPTRTLNGVAYPVSSGIIILSDGEMNDPKSGSDGVDPGDPGNVSFASTTPCEDALSAATAAKAAGTLVFSIAYDDSNAGCDDSGGTGPANNTCTATSYSGSGPYTGSACGLMAYLASGSGDFADEDASAGDLTSAFARAGTALTGNSVLAPDCSDPPNCT
jgi:Flp pilus assembly protein TadG